MSSILKLAEVILSLIVLVRSPRLSDVHQKLDGK